MHTLIITGGSVLLPVFKSIMKETQFDYIIAADKGMEACYQLQVIPNEILGDFDSVNEEVHSYYKNQLVTIKAFPPEKDFTDTDLAVRLAIEKGSERITILGATGTRFDHTLANVALLKRGIEAGVKLVIIDANNRIRLLSEGITIKKCEQFGEYVSLLPMSEQVTGITLQGFKYPLYQATLLLGENLGVSNEIEAEEASVMLESGLLLMIESKD